MTAPILVSREQYARAVQIERVRRQRAAAKLVNADPFANLRDDYEAWATQHYKIKNKHDTIQPLTLRPCQRRVGEVEKAQLARSGRSRIYVLKGRQGGISTDQQARALHLCSLKKHKHALTLADTRERANDLFAITRRAIMLATPGTLPKRGDAQTREVSFPEQDSKFSVNTAGTGDTTAIGLTLSRLHGSEYAHWEYAKEALAAATPALEHPGTTIVLETTGSGYGTEGHDFWLRSQAGETGYECVFIPWWECDPELYQLPLQDDERAQLIATLTEEEVALVAMANLTPEQISWRRAKIGEFGRAEFLNQYAEDDASCWMSVGGMYYDAEQLKVLRTLPQPQPIETLYGGDLLIYGEAAGEEVIIGADTAEGPEGGAGKNDASTFTARAFPSWRRLATYHSTTVQPREFASILCATGKRLGKGARGGAAFLVVEKNFHGITVLRHVRDDEKYKITRVYHREPLARARTEPGGPGQQIGWLTSEESKPIMLSAARELFGAVAEQHAEVPDERTLTQALTVRRDSSGKYTLNGRDDLVGEMLCWIGRSAPRSQGVFVA